MGTYEQPLRIYRLLDYGRAGSRDRSSVSAAGPEVSPVLINFVSHALRTGFSLPPYLFSLSTDEREPLSPLQM